MGTTPWRRALVWLSLLAPFFFISYNFAAEIANQRADVPVLMFSWERHIPFLAWTILPYWSLDLLYAVSLFVCTTRRELDLHGVRLLLLQVASVACFLMFPLRCAVERPLMSGWEASLFDFLLSFDKPYNQAPSLHVSIAVVLAARFRRHTQGYVGVLLCTWFAIVALSALTTWQHHFIDIPTGFWMGLLILAALPERRTAQPHLRLTMLYLLGAAALTALAFLIRGFAWILFWPGFSLSMVAAAYWTGNPDWLAKRYGRVAFWMWPYRAGAWINSRIWTRGEAPKNPLADGVWIGRAPSRVDREGMNSVVDLTAELCMKADSRVPILDLTLPTDDQLDRTVSAIASHANARPTLVCCALGYSRAAIGSAAWLIAAGHAVDTEDAWRQIRNARPQVVLGEELKLRLKQWFDGRNQAKPEAPVLASSFIGLIEWLMIRVVALLSGARSRWQGCVPSLDQRIYVANHSSHLDSLLVSSALPGQVRRRTRPVAAAEYWIANLFREFLIRHVFRAVLLERSAFEVNPLHRVAAALRQGDSLIFFPEGTRGAGGKLQPLKPGIFCLARWFPTVDIVPVWIEGSHKLLPKASAVVGIARCQITFGAPLRWQPGQDQDEFLENVRKALETLQSYS